MLRRLADLMIRARRGAGRAAGHRAGQAARRGAGSRSSTRSPSTSGSARRRSASTAATIPTPWPEEADHRHEGGDRRHRGHHAVELPVGDADAQVGAGARGRLHDGAQARGADAALARSPSPRSPRRPACRPVSSRSSPATRRTRPRSAVELTSNPIVRKVGFTGSTEVGKILMAPVRRPGEEDLARAGRQRAVHRLRRRRPREAVAAALDLQVPQLRPDVHLGQPDARPGRDLRRLPRRVHRRRVAARGRRRLHRRRQRRPADRRAGDREGRAPRRERASRAAPSSSSAARASRASSSSRRSSPASPRRWR